MKIGSTNWVTLSNKEFTLFLSNTNFKCFAFLLMQNIALLSDNVMHIQSVITTPPPGAVRGYIRANVSCFYFCIVLAMQMKLKCCDLVLYEKMVVQDKKYYRLWKKLHCLRMSIFFEHWTVCYDTLLSCTG